MTGATALAGGLRRPRDLPWGRLALGGAVAIWFAPTLVRLAVQEWNTEQGAQGLVTLVAGLWILTREWRAAGAVPRTPAPLPLAVAMLAGASLVQFAGRLADVLTLEVLAAYGVLVTLVFAHGGRALCRRLAFPLVFLLAAVPVPATILAEATRGLKLAVSGVAVDAMAAMGFEVAQSGVSLFVDNYELLVEEACSGMNSLLSLSAIGVLYAYLRHRLRWRRALILAVAAPPVAIAANVVRICVLMALVHGYGVQILDGPLHLLTGLATFVFALGVLMALDRLIDLAPSLLRRA